MVTSLQRQARRAFRSRLARGLAITRLVQVKEWPGPEFPGPATTRLRRAREWPVRAQTAVIERALAQVVHAPGVHPGLTRAARALPSNSVPVALAAVAQAAQAAQVAQVGVGPAAAVGPAGGVVVVPVAVLRVRSDAVARKVSLGSPNGQSAKNLR